MGFKVLPTQTIPRIHDYFMIYIPASRSRIPKVHPRSLCARSQTNPGTGAADPRLVQLLPPAALPPGAAVGQREQSPVPGISGKKRNTQAVKRSWWAGPLQGRCHSPCSTSLPPPADKGDLGLLIKALTGQEVPDPAAAPRLIRQECPAARWAPKLGLISRIQGDLFIFFSLFRSPGSLTAEHHLARGVLSFPPAARGCPGSCQSHRAANLKLFPFNWHVQHQIIVFFFPGMEFPEKLWPLHPWRCLRPGWSKLG